MELLAEIDHPGVMVHLDSYHMNIEENSAAEAVQACGDKLRYVSRKKHLLSVRLQENDLSFNCRRPFKCVSFPFLCRLTN